MKIVRVDLCPLVMGVIALFFPSLLLAQSQGTPQLNLPTGPYAVTPVSNNVACLDVSGAAAANGTKIQVYGCNETGAQRWSLVQVSTSVGVGYQLVTGNSGSCLDIDADAMSDGTLMHEWQCLGPSQLSQIWQPYQFGSSFELVSLYDGKCLDLPSGNSTNGTPLQQWTCQQGQDSNQLWNLALTSAEGTAEQGINAGPYHISPGANRGVCVDVSGGATANGAAIQAYQCNGTQAQNWTLVPVNTTLGPGYQVVNSNSGACLDINFDSVVNGALTHQWQCLGPTQLSQVWQLYPFGTSVELVSLNSGMCLDLTNGSQNNGTQLQQWSCDEGRNANQLWNLSLVASTANVLRPAVPQSSVGQQAAQADMFVDSIGVQTHLDYLATPYYTQWPQVFAELKASGIRHIRDGNTTSPTLFAEHRQLAAAGIGAMIGVPMNAATATALLSEFAAGAGDLDSIEAPNECDNGDNCGTSSLNGIANVAAFMPLLDASGKQLNVPIVGPAFVSPLSYGYSPNLSQVMNYNNLHLYFGGRNPGSSGWGGGDAEGHLYGSMPFWLDQTNLNGPGVPVFVTETGYLSYPNPTAPWTIPESVEANYKPRLLFLNFNAGIKRTYLYELVDELAEPGFGLLRSDLSEKPALVAIKAINSLLADPGPAFQPGKLDYTFTGGDSTINTSLLQKRDGTFWLVIWSEQSSYDPSTNTPTPIASQNVALSLVGSVAVKTVYRFDSTGNVNASSLSTPSQTITLPINDSLTIVQVTPR